MDSVKRFLLDLVFPASEEQSLAMFLFLMLFLMASYASVPYSFVASGAFLHSPQIGTPLEVLVLICVGVCVFLFAALLITWLLLGWINAGADAALQPGTLQGHLRGMPTLLYAITLVGAAQSFDGAWASVGLSFIATAVILGVLLVNIKYAQYLPSSPSSGHPLRPAESLVGVLIAGSLFIHVWALQGGAPLVAVASAYLSFAFIVSLYRTIGETFGFSV